MGRQMVTRRGMASRWTRTRRLGGTLAAGLSHSPCASPSACSLSCAMGFPVGTSHAGCMALSVRLAVQTRAFDI